MKGWIKSLDNWIYQNRALSLLLTVMLTLALVGLANWLSGSDLFRQFFFPKICDKSFPATCDPLDWKDLFQAAILILGLPVAFLLWHWRDRNVRDQIDNARKDNNLKEFQQLQLWAAGVAGSETVEQSKETLQVVALHQLRGYALGDYGESYRRPAFEIFRARLAASALENGSVSLLKKLDRFRRLEETEINLSEKQNRKLPRFDKALYSAIETVRSWKRNQNYGLTHQAERLIFREEGTQILANDYPLFGLHLSGFYLENINISDAKMLSSQMIGTRLIRGKMNRVSLDGSHMECIFLNDTEAAEASFINAYLEGAVFENCDLTRADFTGARLLGARFWNCKLSATKFSYSNLYDAHFSDCDLAATNFSDALLRKARFRTALADTKFDRADLRGAQLYEVNPTDIQSCAGALFDTTTLIFPSKEPDENGVCSFTGVEIDTVKQALRDRGMKWLE
jgi:uncharacterized protein YjbI with pentapeptide repeats